MEVPTVVKEFLAEIEREAGEAGEVVAVDIRSDKELAVYANFLRGIKTRLKELSEKRLALTRPLDDTKRKIMALFEPYQQKLQVAESQIKNGIVAYEASIAEQRRREQEEADRVAREIEAARKRELMEKARAAAETNEVLAKRYATKALEVHVAPVNVAAAKRPGVAMRTVWKFRIIDESKLPRHLLVADEKKIGELVRHLRGLTQIDGVEVYSEPVVAGRGY